MDIDEGRLEALRQEASDVLTMSRQNIDGADRMLSIGVVFLTAVLPLAWRFQFSWIFLFLPPVLGLLITLQFHSFGNGNALIEYRRHLETKLNALLKEDIYLWANRVEETRRALNSWALRLAVLILFCLFLTSIGGGIYILAHFAYPTWSVILYGVGVLISLLAVTVATIEQLDSWRKTKAALTGVSTDKHTKWCNRDESKNNS